MNGWLLIAIAVLLLVLMVFRREGFVEATDREGNILGGPGTRPSLSDGAWRSKIEAQIPIGGSNEDYMKALQKFYDEIYSPMRTANKTASPKDTQVEAFLDGLTIPNLSKDSLRQIILSGFSIDKTESAGAREEKQVKFKPTKALQPRDGVDEVYGHRKEEAYVPADPRAGELPEGIYAPTEQTQPDNEGMWDDKSTSWSPAAFASVCEGGKCAQNVL